MSALTPVAISYSGGTSSEWLVRAVVRGIIPRPTNVAVFFADTGDEHVWTYPAVDRVEAFCRRNGLAFLRTKHPSGSLGDHILRAVREKRMRMDQPPLWIDKGGGHRGRAEQRCSREFKTYVLRRAQRRWLRGLRLPKHIANQPHKMTTWLGFAADEPQRAQRATGKRDVEWERLDFPAIRVGRTRAQQRADLIEWTGRAPDFSMCVFCPWKNVERWGMTTGRDLARAIEIDEAIRDADEFGLTKGPAFLSSELIPVADLVQRPLEERPPGDPTCDSGRCFL